jgi:GNAT superfamily N-acetyltransferase
MRAATKVAISPQTPEKILGFFTLIAIKVIDRDVPDELARRATIRDLATGAPAILLAQLGVDVAVQRFGLGRFLLGHALRRAVAGAVEVGGIALIVDAVDLSIAQWYQKQVPDFRPLTQNGLRLILSMRILAAAISRQKS